MEKKEFLPEDQELLNSFINIATSIDKLYKELCYLEINGQKDSDKYINTIRTLESLLKIEGKQYENPYLTTKKLKSFIHYLLINYTSMDDFLFLREISTGFRSINDIYLLEPDKNIILRRILNKMQTKISLDYGEIKNDLPKEIEEILKTLSGDNFGKIMEDGIKNSVQLRQAFNRDHLNMFLSLVEDYKKEGIYESNLTIIKYNIATANGIIEDDLVKNLFTIDDSIYFSSKFAADLLKIPPTIFDAIKSDFAFLEVAFQAAGLFGITTFKYKNDVNTILRQCFLRSALLFLDDNAIKKFRLTLLEYTKSESYLRNYAKDIESRNSVSLAFEKVSEDRKKTKVISFDQNFKIN